MVHAMIEQKQYSVAKIWFSRHRSQTPLGTFFVHKHSIFLIIFLVEIVMLWKNKLSDNYGTNHRDFIHQISGVQNLPHSCENFSLQSIKTKSKLLRHNWEFRSQYFIYEYTSNSILPAIWGNAHIHRNRMNLRVKVFC